MSGNWGWIAFILAAIIGGLIAFVYWSSKKKDDP
jgi:hypothetical protein